nr:hypothetical protein [Candidatus Sigynarchaeota archaeon]
MPSNSEEPIAPGWPDGLPLNSKKLDEQGTTGNMDFTAAVFSQAADPASGIYFNYRVGPNTLAGFGASAVHYRLGNKTLRLDFPGSNVVIPAGINPLDSVTSYFYGNDPAKWRSGLTDYGAVIYENLYPGIDLAYKVADGQLKYEFIVHAGADPASIAMEYSNADGMMVEPGEVRVQISGETMHDTGLVVYQDTISGHRGVLCNFYKAGALVAGFAVGAYDVATDLVIDPLNFLSYSTYLGGGGQDIGYGIAVENGTTYVTGYTQSDPFPTTAGAYDTTFGGGGDVFVTKLSADGSSLIYCTYLGGGSLDRNSFNSIAVENGAAYVTGQTSSNPFPTTAGAYDTTFNGVTDAFVTKLSPDGSSLIYSTYLGGGSSEEACGIAVENGAAYVTGQTSSNPFPTTAGAYETTYNGGINAFVAKVAQDIDCDGMPDDWEIAHGLNPQSNDAGGDLDADGFTNLQEYLHGTLPNDADTDDDGMTDGWEHQYGLNPLVDDASGNPDNDGITNVEEFNHGTSPISNDTDGDGMADGWEIVNALDPLVWDSQFDPDSDGLTNLQEFQHLTTPLKSDSDDDGMPDGWEVQHGTNPIADDANVDLDGDGLSNLAEYRRGTDPATRDTTNDDRVLLGYSTFLGGIAYDEGQGIAVEGGYAYVSGRTWSSSIPTTSGVLNASSNGVSEGYIAKLSLNGASLLYCTFIGGLAEDGVWDIAVENGYAYFVGDTTSENFPTTPGAFDRSYNPIIVPRAWDLFVSKLNRDGSALVYSTYLGGSGTEHPTDIEVENGSAYVTGYTLSWMDFPTTPGAFDTSFNWGTDVFITKLAADGASLIYSTFVGGSNDEWGGGLDVENGYAYVTGTTLSADFPTTPGAFDTTYNGNGDEFVFKLSRDGTSSIYSTFLGGSSSEIFSRVAVESGCAYICGTTISADFPVTDGAFDTIFNTGRDAFVSKLSTGGSSLIYSTFVGGTITDEANAIAVENGYAYITGNTNSSNFPVTSGAYDTTWNGGFDAWAMKLDLDGALPSYSTYLGGSAADGANKICVEHDGVYIIGNTYSTTYPTTAGAFDRTENGDADAFVTKLVLDEDNDGLSDDWETTFGQAIPSADLDTDGISNLLEYQHGTSPIDPDTDDDGMPDGWEVTNTFNPLVNEAASDADSDGLTNLAEYQHGTNPRSNDTDTDGMPDGWEVTNALDPAFNDAGHDPDFDGLTNLQEYQHGTNPNIADTDFDGMPDGWEVTNTFNPLVNEAASDADSDGLTNLAEYQHGTNPRSNDTDTDGLSDGNEINIHHTDPLADADADGDGLDDAAEINIYGTNPHNIDTDGDGFSDGAEVTRGTNPLDAADYPGSGSGGFFGLNGSLLGFKYTDWIVMGIGIIALLAIFMAMALHRKDKKLIAKQARENEQLASKPEAKKGGSQYVAEPAVKSDLPPSRDTAEPAGKDAPKPGSK